MKCGAFSLTESCLKQRQVLVLCLQGPESHIFLSIRTAAFLQRRSRHRCHLPFLICSLTTSFCTRFKPSIHPRQAFNANPRGECLWKRYKLPKDTEVEVSKSRSELIINRHMLRLMLTWNGRLGEICVRIDPAHACPLRQVTSSGVVTSEALCWPSLLTYMQIRNPSAIAMAGIFQLHSL